MRQEPLDAIRDLTAAWIRKDCARMSRCLTDDILETGPAFPHALEGKQAFSAEYRPYLTGSLRIISYRILRPRTISLSPRHALIHFSYRMRTQSGDILEDSRGKESILLDTKGEVETPKRP